MKTKKKPFGIFILVIVVFFLLWASMFTFDYNRVNHLKMPVFVYPIETQDDGGSGIYQGFGYYFEIEGNFLPEDERADIIKIDMYLFGNHVLGVIT